MWVFALHTDKQLAQKWNWVDRREKIAGEVALFSNCTVDAVVLTEGEACRINDVLEKWRA